MDNAAEHPLLENEEGQDTEDEDPANMMLRAGYLAGMSMKCERGTEDRRMLQRASRSLFLAAKNLLLAAKKLQ